MTNQKKTGPAPELLKIEGDWMKAVSDTLKKAKPATGWPAPKAKKRAAKSKK